MGFRLPSTQNNPLIMVGPGTGVAPFIGFLEHKSLQIARVGTIQVEMLEGYWRGTMMPTDPEKMVLAEEQDAKEEVSSGKMYLFFGCRHPDHDFVFRDELQDYVESGVLSSLESAFSRYKDQEHQPKYVYDLLRRKGKQMFDLLVHEGANFFVCGSLKMATSVHDVIIEILEQHGNMSRDAALEFTKGMLMSGKYKKDVWG